MLGIKRKVRKNILPVNTTSLWNSVKIAKDLNVEPIPKNFLKGETQWRRVIFAMISLNSSTKRLKIRNQINITHTKRELHVRKLNNIKCLYHLFFMDAVASLNETINKFFTKKFMFETVDKSCLVYSTYDTFDFN